MTATTITAPMTAAQLLFGDDPLDGMAERLGQAAALTGARHELAAVGATVGSAAHRQLAAMAVGFCQLDLGSVLLSAWRKRRALLDAADRTRDTGSVEFVSLLTRSCRLTQHPSVEVVLGPARAVGPFTLAVGLSVDGVAGEVSGGALVALRGGRGEVAASFSVYDQVLASERRPFDVGLAVPLGGGLPLGVPRPRAPVSDRAADGAVREGPGR